MNNRKFSKCAAVAVIATVSLGLTGASSLAQAQDSATDGESESARFARGAQTWADNCDRCHNMRDPKEFRDDQWRSIVSHMRVRGGLTGGEARDALFFLQGGSDAPTVAANAVPTSLSVAPGENTTASGDGQAVYQQTCIACHGSDGRGAITGVPDFTDGNGVLAKSDSDLVENITNGFQSPGSFMAMPPKGGNPALSGDDVASVLAYIKAEFGK